MRIRAREEEEEESQSPNKGVCGWRPDSVLWARANVHCIRMRANLRCHLLAPPPCLVLERRFAQIV